MYFDKKEFKKWFSPKTNYINPNIPPKNLFELVYIPLYFMVFGFVVVPIALLSSTKLK